MALKVARPLPLQGQRPETGHQAQGETSPGIYLSAYSVAAQIRGPQVAAVDQGHRIYQILQPLLHNLKLGTCHVQKEAILMCIKEVIEWSDNKCLIIQGHRDFPNANKACPCFDAKAEYRGIV